MGDGPDGGFREAGGLVLLLLLLLHSVFVTRYLVPQYLLLPHPIRVRRRDAPGCRHDRESHDQRDIPRLEGGRPFTSHESTKI